MRALLAQLLGLDPAHCGSVDPIEHEAIRDLVRGCEDTIRYCLCTPNRMR